MSKRERWIMYPLLFMALLLGFKSNAVPPTEIRVPSLICQELKIVDATGRETQLVLSKSPQGGGALLLYGAEGSHPAVEVRVDGEHAGILQLNDAQNRSLAALAAGRSGGVLSLNDAGHTLSLHLGHHELSSSEGEQVSVAGLYATEQSLALVPTQRRIGRFWGNLFDRAPFMNVEADENAIETPSEDSPEKPEDDDPAEATEEELASPEEEDE